MDYRRSTSNEYPEAVDCTSSPTTVYLRKNIQEIEDTDPITGETKTIYQYDEAWVSKDEYIKMLQEQISDTEEVLAELLFGGDEE